MTEQEIEQTRKVGSGRQPKFSDLEECTFQWIDYKISIALIFRRADIQKIAIEMANAFGIFGREFMASANWLDNFHQRHVFYLRNFTTLFKVTDEEVVQHAFA